MVSNGDLMLEGERCAGVYRKVQNTPIFKLTGRYLLIRI